MTIRDSLVRLLRRLWPRHDPLLARPDGMSDPAFQCVAAALAGHGQSLAALVPSIIYAVQIEIAAHGYWWWGWFLVGTQGEVTLVAGSDLSDAVLTQVLCGSLDVEPAYSWLRRHRYPPASRDEVGCVGTMRLFSADGSFDVSFNRGARVLEANPVNALIDRCAAHAPMLIEPGARDDRTS